MKKIIVLLIVFMTPFLIRAQEGRSFFIEPEYDSEARKEVEAVFIYEGEDIRFYVEESWWSDKIEEERDDYYREVIEKLGDEFDSKIREPMISAFGPEPIHPVSDRQKVSVLIHSMRDNAGGYFNSGDQYSRYQNPRSNEMSLLYLSTEVLDYEDRGGFLAHEFMHLLVFNQKERLRGVREEVWLNEARAEFMPTYLGYDDHSGSNLDSRVETFLDYPDTSLTEWLGRRSDYGVVNLFTQYVVDHYGVEVLIDSLKSEHYGIKSINYALEKAGYEENFHQIFNDFKVAVLINDCDLGERFCFRREDLTDLRVTPATSHISFGERSTISVERRTKNWAGNWHKITGGKGTLKVELGTDEDLRVEIPYILCDFNDYCEVNHLRAEEGRAQIQIEEFNEKYRSLTIMPSIQDKITGYNGSERSYLMSWKVEVIADDSRLETLEKLGNLRRLLEELRDQIKVEEDKLCTIEGPLYYGVTDSESVECLQKFLSSVPDIYPEGYVTGNFLHLTEKAVIRFQERYAEEILNPFGIDKGTGYVGERTIRKINNLR